MRIESLSINKFRAFQNPVSLALGKNITCISGVNGVGKSTILAILSNIGEIRGFHTLTGQPFRGEFANVVLFDSDHDTQGNNKVVIKIHGFYLRGGQIVFPCNKAKISRKNKVSPDSPKNNVTKNGSQAFMAIVLFDIVQTFSRWRIRYSQAKANSLQILKEKYLQNTNSL
jgi:predicted ATPase